MPAAADDLGFIGPLRVRDLSALAILRLDMVPSHSVREFDRGWGVEWHYSHANVYGMSDSVAEYLEERGRREELTRSDVDALFARQGDVFYHDFEVGVMSLTLTRAFNKRWQASLNVPWHYYGGGDFDSFVEDFHQTIGIGSAHRDLAARDRAQIIQRVGPDEFVVLGINDNVGLADPSLTIRYNLASGGKWHLVVEGAAKMPLGDEEGYFSTGRPDYGMQLSMHRDFEKHSYFASLSHIWVGDVDLLPHFPLSNTPSVTVGHERLFSSRTSGIVQASWSRSAFRDAEVSESTEDRTQISLGLRRRHGRFVYEAALTENVANFNNTPDIGFHLGVAMMIPSK